MRALGPCDKQTALGPTLRLSAIEEIFAEKGQYIRMKILVECHSIKPQSVGTDSGKFWPFFLLR
jgi:hypothetical protein